ncbi:MAG: spore coat protein CotJB [Clostridia bacterium]|nr:spore coat protein CotJB [Clostridia bacterium]
MNEREKMIREFSAVCFALTDVMMFLDTHPDDVDALKYKKQLAAKEAALREKFESCFGPISAASSGNDRCWEWISDPWPWDYTGGAC